MIVEQLENGKNQFVIFGGDALVTFQSYKSIIANIDKRGTLNLGKDWDYSKTTLTYLYIFLKKYRYIGQNYTKKLIDNILNAKNKRQYITRLIENNKIFINL